MHQFCRPPGKSVTLGQYAAFFNKLFNIFFYIVLMYLKAVLLRLRSFQLDYIYQIAKHVLVAALLFFAARKNYTRFNLFLVFGHGGINLNKKPFDSGRSIQNMAYFFGFMF